MTIDIWTWFCISFGVMLLATLIMTEQGRKFRTNDGTTRKFGILDLEFAANPKEIVTLIEGIYKLPAVDARRVVAALKGQLRVDFIYMPATYGAIFLLCMETSAKLSSQVGKDAFLWAAWAQALCWLCDIGENIYLLNKIGPKVDPPSKTGFLIYVINEWIKWGIASLGAIGSLACMLYFWLSGEFSTHSLVYLIIVVVELIIFFLLGNVLAKREDKKDPENPTVASYTNDTPLASN